jgi:hypothetical protein
VKNRVLGLVCVVVLSRSSPLLAADHAAWLAKVVGVFASQQNRTPIGDIPFAMDMAREADGSVHGRTYADKSSYFDFKFYVNEKGDLFFHETGALPGGLTQSYVLEATKVEGDTITFESKQAPGLLTATVTADGKQLHVVSVVRGRPHANLQMPRMTAPEVIAAIRAANEQSKNADTSPLVQQVVGIVLQGPLGDFAGEYELAQVGTRFSISVDAGKLYGQQPGQERRELKPNGQPGSFAVEGVPYTLQFGRDDQNAVTHLQLLANGQEMMRAAKVK